MIDPKSLTAEERALVDRHASKLYAEQIGNGGDADAAYRYGLHLIEARRAMFCELQEKPATPPAPVAGRGQSIVSSEHYRAAQDAVASELPEAVLDAVYWLMRVGEGFEYADNNLRLKATALEAWARSQQEVPVEATIPVGVWQLEELLKYADLAEVALRTGFHPPEFLFTPADRSLRQCIEAVKEQRDRWLAAEGGR